MFIKLPVIITIRFEVFLKLPVIITIRFEVFLKLPVIITIRFDKNHVLVPIYIYKFRELVGGGDYMVHITYLDYYS